MAQSTDTLFDLFVDGQWRPSFSGEQLIMTEPSTGQSIGNVACGTAADIDLAVNAARTAFETSWRATSPASRGRLLMKLSFLILDHEDELTELEARDTGKPTSQARRDIIATARYFEYYAGASDKIHGDMIPYEPGYTAMVLREPLGVTGHIIPWNYPAQQFARSLAPSLAAGNTIVLKPAEDACLSVLRMVELSQEVGFPKGVINVVPGRGNGAGSALAGHAGINYISFTGSPEVGTIVQQLAAANHIGCTLELGGKSPQIIFADADIDTALESVVGGILQNTGQTCSASSRVLVQDEFFPEFTQKLVARFKSVTFGPHDADCDCGPLVSRRHKERVEKLTKAAIDDGTPVLFRCDMPDNLPQDGHYFAPIIFGPVKRTAKIAMQEVFGPVLAVMSFTDEADAIALANGTEFGLVAAVWSKDADRLMRVAKHMHCGQVFMNNFGAGGGVELPFGGVKRSGHGREKGLEAIREFTASKTIIHKHG